MNWTRVVPREGNVALLLVLAALAGCVGDDDGGVEGSSPATFTFTAPTLVGEGNVFETSLDVGADGTMLACSHGGFDFPSPAWASRDGGATWTALAYWDAPIPGGDCDVAIADGGTWYVAYTNLPSVFVAVSTDAGASWRNTYHAVLPAFPPIDRPWILAVGDSVYLTYKSLNAYPIIVMFAKTTDGGLTWADTQVAALGGPSERINANVGKMLVSEDGGDVRVPLHRFNDAEGAGRLESFHLAVSRDAGATWTIEPVIGPIETRPDYFLPMAARAADGTLYHLLPLVGAGPESVDMAVIWSLDDGATWSEPFVLMEDLDLGGEVTSWIDGGPGSSAFAAWQHAGDGDGTWLVSGARIDARAEPRTVVVDALTAPAGGTQFNEFLMIDHDAAGVVHMVYPSGEAGCDTGCGFYVRERDAGATS